MIVVIVGMDRSTPVGFAPPFVTEGALRLPVFDLPPRPFSAKNMLVNYVVNGLRGQAAPPYCTWTAGLKPCVDLGTYPVHISANQVFRIRYDEIALTDLSTTMLNFDMSKISMLRNSTHIKIILKQHIPHCVLALYFPAVFRGEEGKTGAALRLRMGRRRSNPPKRAITF